jgi:ABC-type polysaccharide/polyol phosphate export permease
MLNPVAPMLEGLRLAAVERRGLLSTVVGARGAVAWRPAYLAYAAAWSVLGLFGGAVAFARLKRSFADYV